MIRSGERVFISGSSGEPKEAAKSVLASPNAAITTSFVPGINHLLPEMIGQGTTIASPFMHPKMAEAQRQGIFRHLPVSYAGMVKAIAEGPAYDVCVLQVSPPDHQGLCSLGPAAEFLPAVLRRNPRIIAVVNPRVPRPRHAPTIRLADCATVIESATPLVDLPASEVDPVTQRIAENVARFIPEGAVLQAGLGKVPQALMALLIHRRNLRIHTGLLSDGVIELAQNGALDSAWQHVTTVALGSQRLYDWLADGADIHIRGADYTHGPRVLAALEGLVAVNSALEVDLFGQCNLELAGGRAVSGAGGATDFARAARMSPGGVSIIALPASFGAAATSRIVPRLGADSIASLARTEADIVITEAGFADLRLKSVHERAEALIEIATPAARATLQAQWNEIRLRL